VAVNRAPPPPGFAWGIEGTPGEPYPYPEIKTVVPGSNAAQAGLMVGDTLVSVNGHDLRQLAPLFPDRAPKRGSNTSSQTMASPCFERSEAHGENREHRRPFRRYEPLRYGLLQRSVTQGNELFGQDNWTGRDITNGRRT